MAINVKRTANGIMHCNMMPIISSGLVQNFVVVRFGSGIVCIFDVITLNPILNIYKYVETHMLK